MRAAQRKRDQLVENGRLKLNTKKIGIVREQRWIEVALDGSKVESIILQAGVVSLNQDGKRGEQQ